MAVEQQDMINIEEFGSTLNSQVPENGRDDEDGHLPDPVLLTAEGRKDYLEYGVPLYRAAIKGDGEEAERIIASHPKVMQQAITERMETVLHIAVLEKHVGLAMKLVNNWIHDSQLLRLKNTDGNTALSYAAMTGKVLLARLLIRRDSRLSQISNNEGQTPLHLAALFGRKSVFRCLYNADTYERFTDRQREEVFFICIRNHMYESALRMTRDMGSQIAIAQDSSGETALHVLARNPLSSFSVNEKRHRIRLRTIIAAVNLYERNRYLELVTHLWKKTFEKQRTTGMSTVENPALLITLDAAQAGNVEFLVEVFNLYPELIWTVNNRKQTIFHYATLYRHESIFSLIHDIGSIKDLIAAYKDEDNNNMLHLAARLPPENRLGIVSGAALRMHRELLWFKEVKRVVPRSYREQRNIVEKGQGLTPWELFVKEHKKLMEEAEEWMKTRAQSLLVVPTLIASVVFSSIFTVPGSAPDNTGKPNFLHRFSFSLFVVSDATALFSALASILMFLSILTSRYTERDFIRRLPFLLLMGLVTLFISICTMMVAFSATVFIVYYRGEIRIPLAIAILVSVPLALYASLNLPLFIDLWHATYGSRSLFKPRHKLIEASLSQALRFPRLQRINAFSRRNSYHFPYII